MKSVYRSCLTTLVALVVFTGVAAEPVGCSSCEYAYTSGQTGFASIQAGQASAYNDAYDDYFPYVDCDEWCDYNCSGWVATGSVSTFYNEDPRWVDVNQNGIPEDNDYWVVSLGGSCPCEPENLPVSIGGRIELTTTQKILQFFGLYRPTKPVVKKVGG